MIRTLAALLLALGLSACATMRPAPVTVGIAAINDFHGNLLPPHQAVLVPDGKDGAVQVPAGGVAYLASAIDSIRAKYPNHLTLSAGDLISASPFLATLYNDEPTIGAMNRIGLDYNALGNHEFDRGRDELLRMANGGCAQFTKRKSCAVEPFEGAKFGMLAANTFTEDGKTLFPPYALRSFGKGRGKVTVGIIGLDTTTIPQLISPALQAGLHWADEADSANALVPELKAKGADVIVVLIHQGATTANGEDIGPDSCDNLHGTARDDIRPIIARFDPRIDVVISGHTHWTYVCDWPSARDPSHRFLLTSAGLWGKLVTDISLTIDPVTHRLVGRKAHNVIVQSEPYRSSTRQIDLAPGYPAFAPRPDIAAYVKRYADAADSYMNRVVGHLSGRFDKTTGREFNMGGPLGKLIADGQLAATRANGAELAFMNPFGVRVSIVPAADGAVTFGQISATQPFNDTLVTISLTGAEIKEVLEEGLDTVGPEQLLTPSAGFIYHVDRSFPVGQRIRAMTLNGVALEPTRSYRVTVSTFLSKGGDTFASFTKGRDPAPGPVDVAALEAWIAAANPRAAPTDPREIDDRPDLNLYNNPAPPGQVY